ncbi:D-alanyl-D-alanine carboxypeptidase-like protein [Haloactinopolyspora alba]|uniref:D-alanyl-D-alanine carboxypeptidase-like protein n=1 Tax=Haloactinopolyspora alba TaxID=648780 RepID=A0A2P8E7I8_9ACTN|nr:D-alanyl-D-alanine carboxypeptidase family protein [Haloactinopolyspora alba]PSL05388.1 D-alanyl-D-alanine carboxypeptidase-like protein [Haloactinopolyspora alba]
MTSTSLRKKRSAGSATLVALGGVLLGGAVFAVLGDPSEASDGGGSGGSGESALAGCTDRGDLDDLGGLTDPTRQAWLAAVDAAAADGAEMSLTSGYRTCQHQQRLFDEKVDEYGSVEEASVWALPPDESNHVRGIALDVGPGPAADWLQDHGARFGLCKTMSWEWWHFEYDPEWERSESCPDPAPRP